MRTPKGNLNEIKKTDTQWLTQDNKILDIEDMDPSHIFNCVQMMKNKNKKIVLMRQVNNHYKPFIQIPEMMIERMKVFKQTNPEYFL